MKWYLACPSPDALILLGMNQVYLVEEDQANRRARKKAGGNSGKRYTEGWVEFEDKKIARGQSLFSAEKLLFTV